MNACLRQLWNDETGAIVSAEIMLIGTILVIGVIVGLKSLRDAVTTELADLAQAFANVNQSYSYSGVCGHASYSGGGSFQDQQDFCDCHFGDSHAQQSKCVNVCAWANAE